MLKALACKPVHPVVFPADASKQRPSVGAGHCAVGVRMNHRKFGNDAMIDRKDSATDRLTLCVLVLALLKY